MNDQQTYRIADRRSGTALFGLTVPQLVLVTAAVLAAVLVPVAVGSGPGVLAGLGLAAVLLAAAFVPVGGDGAWQAAAVLVGFVGRLATGRLQWTAPLPLLPAAADGRSCRPNSVSPAGRRWLPRCLAGLDLQAVPRPDWAGGDRTIAPVGVVADRRSGRLTVVIEVRGGGFGLSDPPDRHRRLADWAQVLSQFARESSPVIRLGWSLWSAPAPVAEMQVPTVVEGPLRRVAEDYGRLLTEAAAATRRHELRLWLTVDPRRLGGPADDPAAAALAAAQALISRCAAAGLVCSAPLSPVAVAEAVREQTDPTAPPPRSQRRGLAEQAGLTGSVSDMDGGHAAGAVPELVQALPLAVDAQWDAVRVDGCWHRVFWVAQWPTLDLAPGWWEPLLLDATGVRTVAVVLESVPVRVSRRRINADAVALQGQLQLRERHAFRVPVGLQRAQAEVDQREAELQAGFPEYGYLALACVTAAGRDELDRASQALVDDAARCGIVQLRPLHGRHDAALACTLPIGRAPGRDLLGGTQ